MSPLFVTDAYKLSHKFQYPEGTQGVYSNMTPRGSRIPGIEHMVVFGIQYLIKRYLLQAFNEDFFWRPKHDVLREYERRVKCYVGGLPNYDHIAALHDLGYLPLHLKALPEGSRCPMRVPFLTMVNTLPEFGWLTNYLETMISDVVWMPCTSATIADEYRRIGDCYAKKTGMPPEFVQWQSHDFSCRGLSSPESAMTSGMAHLTSFTGTDTIPALEGLELYYGADAEKELLGGSVPATEHSVMCAGMEESELETFSRLLTIYPTGILSVVSDTWDLWRVLTVILPALRDQIMARDGKIVIRPDSGDPEKILCGDTTKTGPAGKGVIQLLWELFGGTISSTGYKILDSHVGAIYGDSITLDRANSINTHLAYLGFASQVVFGVGSFSYQYVTRDTFGTAIKSTAVKINNVWRNISKNPVTDNGLKKSACGFLRVDKDGDSFKLTDQVSADEEDLGELKTVFNNGQIYRTTTLREIRHRLHPDWNI
jgi:nicotinamide phosphoribosyltransferase